jgi:hypothetical protein
VIRDVAWIADTIAHDAFVAAIFKDGPTDRSTCERCEAPLVGQARLKALQFIWRGRFLCAECSQFLRRGVYTAHRLARLKAAGRCVACGEPNDRADRVTCERCKTKNTEGIAARRRRLRSSIT